MSLFLRTAFFSIVCLLIGYVSIAQDSSFVQWEVSSKKLNSNEYELQFKGKVKPGKFLYLFTKDAEGLDSIAVKFTDSAIVNNGSMQILQGSSSYVDPIFENKNVLIAKQEVSLSQKIKIDGTVPAQLKGTLVYATGAEEEFLPAQEFLFDVKLEGGIAQT
ncbi:MAG TPA: hypothetical protein VK173_12000, partial [Lacibacter sp.]|nr:hypothetical protein [Lacibacter sp.]